MNIFKPKKNFSLKAYNTFGIDQVAENFISVNNLDELRKVLADYADESLFVLGGGSNLLLTRDVPGLTLHIGLKGKEIVDADYTKNHVLIKAMAGEVWHEFVLWTLENGLGGLENLSLIPGNVGAAPIQNIGAYGVELKDTFERCEAMEIKTGLVRAFSKTDCQFDYRHSIFKTKLKNKYIITAVYFKLTKQNHQLKTEYGTIQAELAQQGVKNQAPSTISKAVISIRQQKLPDPKIIGNSGSFFKNPVIEKALFQSLTDKYPEMPFYEAGDLIKIPAAWLIEQAGYKGKRFGDAGVHDKQALVLVNHGNAKGQDILSLSEKIQQSVFEKFGIQLTPEVNIYP
ncbi:MAG: UDP-N-acetylenolpyruvoylglucosamine reductase [Flavobacteriales bacterium CG_4_9_14_3_um_filter_40_17]|nr:MAG: UDP-N-acetylenolpyruvoylglucosamine reductase [Flavobacteriales bacterium CG_4_9_14_3_um_filter_40_17]